MPESAAATDSPASLPGVSAREVEALAAAGLATISDLLDYFPRRHEDRRRFDRFPNQPMPDAVCLRGIVFDLGRRGMGAGKGFTEATILQGHGNVFESGRITLRWFNMPYIHRVLAAGQDIIVYGKVREHGGRLIINHPEFEILDEDGGETSIHLERIVPVYRNITGIPQRRLREIIHLAITTVDPATTELPVKVDSAIPRHTAYRHAHFSESDEQATHAMRRFALEDFLRTQLNVAWRRKHHRQQPGRTLGRKTTLLKKFYESLPFDLTNAQKRSIRELIDDMRQHVPMRRLLQGDVGAGKTFVAMAAMLLAVESGCQAALMAPTQILAEQHFLTFRKWLEPLGLRLALQTSGREETTHAGESADILIGTHALLHRPDAFRDLGFVVIDEQHKFGVLQRETLISHGITPDVLVMTATPIPRTLTMTLYGDLDVSLLDERPVGRGRLITGLRIAPKQSDVTNFVKSQLAEGRQAYLVYPLVEESDSLKIESAVEAHAKWSKRLGKFQVGLLHGKLPAEEKERVMRQFRDGEIAALVATSVIEVGVDVPNANVMILHHAERFGLAQLHQLRGRIGRGGHKSYCVLVTDGKSDEALEKLRVIEQSADGFEIAEADLRLRGPGELMGTRQSGMSAIRFPEFLADTELIREARAIADRLLEEDPALDANHAALHGWIE
ncbi:MAG: ATP-dependent DNA helicase RecG [Luteolibacter sp.]|jgi:ATP-dependent DNA helicase RecG